MTSTSNANKYGWIFVSCIVILMIGIGLYLWLPNNSSSRQLGHPEVPATVVPSDSVVNTPPASEGTTAVPSGRAEATSGNSDSLATDQNVSYQDAKDTFDYRFQFDNNCHSTTGLPSFGLLNVKQGAAIMLENHGTSAHTLAIGPDSHKVAGADFVVLNAPKVTKATGYLVTCDSKGAGRLYVYP